MKRLDTDRQNELEPKRLAYAKEQITRLGFQITYQDEKEIRFEFQGETVKFFPYTGWATGKTIKDGRGLNNLLKQIK